MAKHGNSFGNLEGLELRALLSTVNITDFGARPNDNNDDRGAILAAIRASKPGDTIRFAGGVFNSSDDILLAGDRSYVGENDAIVRGRAQGNEGQLFKIQSDNVTVRGLTFEGGGIFLEKLGSGRNSAITIDNNVFRLDTSGHHSAAITFTSGLNDTKITNNYFTGYNGSFGIYGYNYMNLTIANNEFVNARAGMHIDAFGNSGNLLVKENYISGAKGMGMEFQGSASNLKFLDNVYEKPNLSSNKRDNDTSFAFSLILDKSSNIEIKRNTVIAPERPDGIGSRIAFEVGGDNTVVEDNYVNGVNHVLASNDGVGSSSILVKNNKFMNYRQGPGGIRLGAVRFEGSNDASTKLSWSTERANPSRQSSDNAEPDVSKPAPPESPAPSDDIAKTLYDEADLVFLSDVKWLSAANGWGPVERDRTVGGKRSEDGGDLKLNGKIYDKGLGVAVDSDIVYNLDGKYSRFFSDIGINDVVGHAGSVTFEVWADGVKVFDSDVVTGRTGRLGVHIKVDGVKELRLVTTDAGDGGNKDHADWADARLLPASKADKYFA